MPFPWAAMSCTAGAAGFVAYAAGCPISRIWGKAEISGDPARRALALSFDDGPSDTTWDVLDLLARFDAKATFFACGANIDRQPDVARAIVAAGHELGNHTYSHPNLLFASRRRVRNEVGWTQRAVLEQTGVRPTLFRPPYGVRGPGLPAALAEHGLRCVLWSTIGHDWREPADRVARRIERGARPGAILCLHDGEDIQPNPDRRATVEALRHALPRLAGRGFAFETVSALLSQPA